MAMVSQLQVSANSLLQICKEVEEMTLLVPTAFY